MVRHAFEVLTEGRRKTRLVCFSDDMDGLRKVPDNVPNRDMLAAHIGKPLSSMPDPFSNEYPSFAAHNNARLRRFLDRFGFEYEFLSATECYKAGKFDATLLTMLEVYDKVMDIILPTLGPERRATYSPFLPSRRRPARCCRCRWWSATPRRARSSIVDPDTGEKVETPVTGGRVKCQWKADWAHALDRARRRLRDVRQGPDRQRDAVVEDLPRARRRCRRRASSTSCSSTRPAARSRSPRATASPSTSG